MDPTQAEEDPRVSPDHVADTAELRRFRERWQREMQKSSTKDQEDNGLSQGHAAQGAQYRSGLTSGRLNASLASSHVTSRDASVSPRPHRHPTHNPLELHDQMTRGLKDMGIRNVEVEDKRSSDRVVTSTAPRMNACDKEAMGLTFYNEASLLERQGRVGEAMPLYRKAFKLVPDLIQTIRQQTNEENAGARVGLEKVKGKQPLSHPLPKGSSGGVQNSTSSSLAASPISTSRVSSSGNRAGRNSRNIVAPRDASRSPDRRAALRPIPLPDKGLLDDFSTTLHLSGLPDRPTTRLHISMLPVEVLLHIFGYVGLRRPDTLEHLTLVCRAWYVYARDKAVWRRLCLGYYPINLYPNLTWTYDNDTNETITEEEEGGDRYAQESDNYGFISPMRALFHDMHHEGKVIMPPPSLVTEQPYTTRPLPYLDVPWSSYAHYHNDPRSMFRYRPRIRYDGVYISVVRYIRPGQTENTYNQPCHLVTYYRYLRFKPCGSVLSVLSSEHPAAVVKQLVDRPGAPLTSRAMKPLLRGRWCVAGPHVLIVVADPEMVALGRAPTFFMHLLLLPAPLGTHPRLKWQHYSSQHPTTGEVSHYNMKVLKNYVFSRVKSYDV